MSKNETLEVHVRNSERGTLDRCPQQWWWSWREGLRPKETAKPLWFGTGIHLALAHYYAPGYKRRKDFIDVWRAFAKEEAEYIRTNFGSIDEDQYVDARTLGESMLSEYVKEYDHDRNWDVIATEQAFELTVPFGEFDTPLYKKVHNRYGDAFILNGTFDGVYRDKADKKIKLMEHKTAASISTRHLPMDNQAGTYWMVAQSVGRSQGWLGVKDNISEITYNFLRKSLPNDKPRDDKGYVTNLPTAVHYEAAFEAYADDIEWPRLKKDRTRVWYQETAQALGIVVLGDRAKVQPPPLFERHAVKRYPRQRQMQLTRLQGEVYRMLAYREGWLPLTKSPDRNSCSWCPFNDMCELHESGGDWEGYRDLMFRGQDPYADHRKSASAG